MTGTKQCDGCHEVHIRLDDFVRTPGGRKRVQELLREMPPFEISIAPTPIAEVRAMADEAVVRFMMRYAAPAVTIAMRLSDHSDEQVRNAAAELRALWVQL